MTDDPEIKVSGLRFTKGDAAAAQLEADFLSGGATRLVLPSITITVGSVRLARPPQRPPLKGSA